MSLKYAAGSQQKQRKIEDGGCSERQALYSSFRCSCPMSPYAGVRGAKRIGSDSTGPLKEARIGITQERDEKELKPSCAPAAV